MSARAQLLQLSKEALAEKILCLTRESRKEEKQAKKDKRRKAQKPFDLSKYAVAHVALKFAYLGWEFQGLAIQKEAANTVEEHLFSALQHLRLITTLEDVRVVDGKQKYGLHPDTMYQRSGRTDIGVSALCQVASMKLRASHRPVRKKAKRKAGAADGIVAAASGDEEVDEEYELVDFARKLNNALPKEIRVYGSAIVDEDFNARFHCSMRTYKYFFVRDNLDLDRMREAANLFVGQHDFRNFCKMDAVNVMHWNRTVTSIDIEPVLQDGSLDSASLYTFTIRGHAFLWHQVRCMVAVLFLVGRHKEEPSVVTKMLDVEAVPRKPIYMYAPDVPLVLWDCSYEKADFKYLPEVLKSVKITLFGQWKTLIMKASVLHGMVSQICKLAGDYERDEEEHGTASHRVTFPSLPVDHYQYDHQYRNQEYLPLLQRATGNSLEEKKQLMSSKKRKTYEGRLQAVGSRKRAKEE